MKILFMGTPEFAVPSLNALLGAGHTVCGVFTQPDKPKNRGMKLLPSPVKVCALSHEIPVFQPAKMRDGEALGYLRELDPEYYRIVDLNNPARVVRALEVCLQTGMPYSRQRTGIRRARPFEIVKIGVDLPREELYDRINRRVDRMLADGLEAEARALYPYRELNALQTVGYREFFDYFDGCIGYDEAVELIKRNSRRYAKRQLTWFRRDPEIRWFRPDDDAAMINYIDFGKS